MQQTKPIDLSIGFIICTTYRVYVTLLIERDKALETLATRHKTYNGSSLVVISVLKYY
ncbi:MAG: hypothetical protein RR086_06285 [Clostridia bacterium]